MIFRRFKPGHDVNTVVEQLRKHGIRVKLQDVSPDLDITFTGGSQQSELHLLVQQHDFERANDVLLEYARNEVSQIPKDHYLHDFSDEELIELLSKPHEWHEFDVAVAEELVAQRGIDITQDELEWRQNQVVEEFRKPEKAHQAWLIVGMMLALAGGLFGLYIGWMFWKSKGTDPNGNEYYLYDEESRVSGRLMFFVSLIVSGIATVAVMFFESWFSF